jgi:hypothetical protein
MPKPKLTKAELREELEAALARYRSFNVLE